MTAKLVWITPDADSLVGYMARVSNPSAKPEDDATNLISYLIKHEHWSPFEMVSACVEVETTRDIARQILRHRSFHFQEFSQRYAKVGQETPVLREARLQDAKNRQNSIEVVDEDLERNWRGFEDDVWSVAYARYQKALDLGIAKEVARALLPEGLTNSRMYISGTIRDWFHYLRVRTGSGTQKEHRLVAQEILSVLKGACPVLISASVKGGLIDDSL